jgi:hypothetical protein
MRPVWLNERVKTGFAAWALFVFAGAILPGRGEEAGPTVLDKGLFSYEAPAGWSVPEMTLSHPVALGPMKDGFAPNIHVDIQSSPKSLDAYVTENLRAVRAAFPDFRLVSRRPFTTAAGLDGIRVVITDKVDKFYLQQMFYFLDGGSNQKLIISACCLMADGIRYAPIFDASIKTFSLE